MGSSNLFPGSGTIFLRAWETNPKAGSSNLSGSPSLHLPTSWSDVEEKTSRENRCDGFTGTKANTSTGSQTTMGQERWVCESRYRTTLAEISVIIKMLAQTHNGCFAQLFIERERPCCSSAQELFFRLRASDISPRGVVRTSRDRTPRLPLLENRRQGTMLGSDKSWFLSAIRAQRVGLDPQGFFLFSRRFERGHHGKQRHPHKESSIRAGHD